MSYRFKDELLLPWVTSLAAGERHDWYRVVRSISKSASGDDGVFAPNMRVPLVEPAGKVFKVVKVELGTLGRGVLHAQTQNLMSNIVGNHHLWCGKRIKI